MNAASNATSPANRVVFQDGLGKRLHIRHPSSHEALEVLKFHTTLTSAPSFEFAVRERVGHLANFNERCYAHVRGVGRRAGGNAPLLLVSDVVAGVRLSELLATTQPHGLVWDLETAFCVVRQLASAVAMLHEHAPEVAHGAIGPQRIVVTPDGRLVLVEHVLGAGLELLQCSPDRYWQEFAIPLPAVGGTARLDQRTDVAQIGVVALALLLGRPLRTDEYPSRISELVGSAFAVSNGGAREPLPAALRSWLDLALQLDTKHAFASGLEAWAELEALLTHADFTIPGTIETFLARCTPPAGAGQSRAVEPIARTERAAIALRPSDAPPVLETRPVVVVERALPTFMPTQIGRPGRSAQRGRRTVALAVLVLAASIGAGAFAWQRYLAAPPAGERIGILNLETTPSGVDVVVDGTSRGATPLVLTLAEGSHVVELKANGHSRKLPIAIRADEQLWQSLDFPKAASQWGQLEVRTDPSGALVTVDDVPAGTSPLRVDLAPGEHSLALKGPDSGLTQRVTIRPGTTTSLTVPLPPGAAAQTFGWIAIDAPVEMQAYERGQLLGTSQSRRIMVSAGAHNLEIVNEVLGYRTSRTVRVGAGEVVNLKIEFPTGTVMLNALPWADVWIDGTRVGDTPIGNLALPLGPHEILFRHPELGERRIAVTVTLAEPLRLNIDLTKR